MSIPGQRNRTWLMLRGLAFVLAAATAFGRPPPDWVRPYLFEDSTWAGTASAIRLVDFGDVRYLTEDRVRRTRRGAIRMVNESGRSRALAVFAYNADTEKLISAQAWIISPDGRDSEVFGTAKFIDVAHQVQGIFWPQQRLLSFPGGNRLLPGATLAWEIQVESQTGISDANWSFAVDLPTAFTGLEVTPLAGGKVDWHATSEKIAAPVVGAAPGSLRWEMRHLLPPVGERPEGFLPEPLQVSARGTSPRGASRIQSWSDMARLAAEIIEPRVVVSSEVKARAEAFVNGRANRWERIRALAEFVQRDIAYLSIVLDKDYLAGYRPHLPADVLRDRRGDCKDKATLLAALLRAIGDRGHVVLVFAGNPQAVREGWPSAAFNHAIVGVPADDTVPPDWPVIDAGPLGRLVLFDATDSITPLGVLAAPDQGGFGLVAAPEATGLVSLPIAAAGGNSFDVRVEAKLDARDVLTATTVEVARGTLAARLRAARERERSELFQRSLEGMLHESIPTLRDLHWKDEWDSTAAQWRLEFDFKAERYVRRMGGTLMLVSPMVFFTKVREGPWRTNQDGVAWVGASTVRKEVRLELPPDAVVEEVPDDVRLSVPNAGCTLTYRREPGAIIVRCEVTENGGFFNLASYEARRTFIQKMQDAERRPVVMRDVPPAKTEAPARK